MRGRAAYIILAMLIVSAVTLRLWIANAFGTWGDPDGYLDLARELADGSHPWHWTLKAVRWREFFKAPLYQVMLSVFTGHPGWFPFPQTGLIVHAALDGITVAALFVLGRALHSTRAGLIAAAGYAFWVPRVLVTSGVWQEHLFVPLFVLGLALLSRAVSEHRSVASWGAAGVVFGLAALTRSAVVPFVPIAAGLCAMTARKTRALLERPGALVLGFAIVTLPYVLFISLAVGRFVPIEDSGFVALKDLPAANPQVRLSTFMRNPQHAPTSLEVGRYLLAEFAAAPGDFVRRHFDYVRLLLKPSGGAFLERMGASGPAAAVAWKAGVHALLDFPFIAMALLAPFGVVLSRHRLVAWLISAWIVMYVVMLALTLWAGARYRAPIEPALIALGTVVLAGGWERATRRSLAGAAIVSACVAGTFALSAGSVVFARANYGVGQGWDAVVSKEAAFDGEAGVNLYATPNLAFSVDTVPSAGARGATTVTVHVAGRPSDVVTLIDGTTHSWQYTMPRAGLVYVAIKATGAGGQPVPMRLRIQ